MYTTDRYLQHLQKRFREWIPWLEQACRASVSVLAKEGTAFIVQVRWEKPDGTEDSFVRYYNPQNIGTLRGGCLKPYAREIILAVLTQRGML